MTKTNHRDVNRGQVEVEGVELWWLCAELARFLAATDEKGFRILWREGVRYKNAIEKRMLEISTAIPRLDDAECFLEYEGWGWAEKLWISGEGDDALALDTATPKMEENCCTELRIGQPGLLAWRCQQAAKAFEKSGEQLARRIGVPFPPKTIRNDNVSSLLRILETNRDPGVVADKQYELPTSDTQPSQPHTSDGQRELEKKIVQDNQRQAFAAWRKWLIDSQKKLKRNMNSRFYNFSVAWAKTNGRDWEKVVESINLNRFVTLWESYETALRRGSPGHYKCPK